MTSVTYTFIPRLFSSILSVIKWRNEVSDHPFLLGTFIHPSIHLPCPLPSPLEWGNPTSVDQKNRNQMGEGWGSWWWWDEKIELTGYREGINERSRRWYSSGSPVQWGQISNRPRDILSTSTSMKGSIRGWMFEDRTQWCWRQIYHLTFE